MVHGAGVSECSDGGRTKPGAKFAMVGARESGLAGTDEVVVGVERGEEGRGVTGQSSEGANG